MPNKTKHVKHWIVLKIGVEDTKVIRSSIEHLAQHADSILRKCPGEFYIKLSLENVCAMLTKSGKKEPTMYLSKVTKKTKTL